MSEHYITFSFEVLVENIKEFLTLTKDLKQGSIIKMRQIILDIESKLNDILNISDSDYINKNSKIEYADEARNKIENVFNGRLKTQQTVEFYYKAISITGQYQDIVKTIYN